MKSNFGLLLALGVLIGCSVRSQTPLPEPPSNAKVILPEPPGTPVAAKPGTEVEPAVILTGAVPQELLPPEIKAEIEAAKAQDAAAEAAAVATLVEEPMTPEMRARPTGVILVYGTPTAGGHVAGGGTYPFGTPVQISATPNTGWSLKSWNDGVIALVRTVVAPKGGSVTYTATFIQATNTPPATNSLVTVSWNPAPSAASYQVFQGPSSGNYTNQRSTTATNLQLSVPPKLTSYIATKSVGSTGLVSTNYSNELVYTAP